MKMTTGEKIKFYRTRLGMTQKEFAQYSGISISTIKKLEADLMHPKYQQLQRVANALGVSVYLFLDFDIETVSDVMALITKMDEQIDIRIEADYDAEGKPDPKTIKLVFDRYVINSKLADYFRINRLRGDINGERNIETENSLEKEKFDEIDLSLEEARLSVCDDATMVTKEYRGKKAVKIYPIINE